MVLNDDFLQKKHTTRIFICNGNRKIGEDVTNLLNLPSSNAVLSTFSDGEIRCEIMEHVRDCHAYVIQSTCFPTNDNIMELCFMVDAIKRSSAKKIVAVMPYFGYSRQDRRPGFDRTPISSRVIFGMLESVGVDEIITVDLHSTQQQGFTKLPVTNISASPIFVSDIWRRYLDHSDGKVKIVSPDVGGVARARSIAKGLNNIPLAIVDKRREKANESEVMNIIGDVEGYSCIMIDDMVDTAGTLCKAAKALKTHGAKYVASYCSHGVLSGDAFDNILGTHELDELVITDTIPLYNPYNKIRVLSVASLISETIMRIRLHKSVSELYTGL